MESSNPYAPPTAPVRDIPVESPEKDLAGLGARFGASLIDGILLALFVYAPLGFSIGFTEIVGGSGSINYSALASAKALIAVPFIAVFIGVTAWLVARNGQTMGKKLVGIKVVRTDSGKAGLGRIFWLRYAPATAISFIPIIGSLIALVDVLLIFRKSRQCIHDQIADTIVINA